MFAEGKYKLNLEGLRIRKSVVIGKNVSEFEIDPSGFEILKFAEICCVEYVKILNELEF